MSESQSTLSARHGELLEGQFHGLRRICWAPVRLLVRHTWLRMVDPPYRLAMIEQIADLLDGVQTLLDVGCGDGVIGAALMEKRPGLEVKGIDIAAAPDARIPMQVYDGVKIPFESNSFDAVLTTDVLHHTNDIPAMLREMARVARRWLIIKDHTVHGPFSRAWIASIDFMTNVPFGIRCVYNYPRPDQWRAWFTELGLRMERDGNLDIGPGSQLHCLYKLRVANAADC